MNAVNLMDHYHELRAGGVQVGGVPQILIRGGSSELLEYNGPRMADSIAKDALAFMDGQLSGGSTFAPATPAPATESTDALLGGATPAAAAPALTGGKKRGPKKGSHHRKHRSKSRSRSRSRSRSKSHSKKHHRHHRMRGGAYGSKMRGYMMGGSKITGGETTSGMVPEAAAAVTEVNLEGGKSRSRSRKGRGHHLDRWRKHVMAYAKQHGISLKKAMSKARASYRRM